MWVYWIAFAMSVTIAYIFEKSNMSGKRIDTICSFIASVPLFFVSSLRYGIGADYFGYESALSYNHYYKHIKEYLYYYLVELVKKIGGEYQCVVVVTALIFCLLVFYTIFHESPNRLLSIYLLMGTCSFFVSMNIVRQMVAASICFLALKLLNDKKYIASIVCVILACGFHRVSIVFLVALLFGKIKINEKVAVAICACVFIIRNQLLLLVRLVFTYLGFDEKSNNGTDNIWFVINFLILAFAAFCYRKNDKKYTLYFNMQIIVTICSCFTGSIDLMDRLMWLFALPQTILIPMAIDGRYIGDSEDNKKIVTVVIVAIYFIYSYYAIKIQGVGALYPYQSILFK